MALSLAAVAQGRKKNKALVASPAVWKDTARSDYRTVGSPLPPFRVVTPKGKSITNKDVANKANLMVMLFNPTCEHCQEVTRTLEKNIDLFKQSHVLLVAASSMMPYLDFFNSTTKVYDYPRLQVGIDSAFLIDRTYGYYSLPQINIYGPDRRLIRYFTGDTPIDSLRPYIQ